MDDVPYALHGGDRKRLDARRVGAILVDGLIFAPITVTAYFYDLGTQLLATALMFVYFFVSDATAGQTIGKALFRLRTVTTDGEIPSPRAAAKRTATRLVDDSPIGLIVMVLSGRRRQRIGDFMARTVVVDADEVALAARPLVPRMLVYPALWLVPALLNFFAYADGSAGGSYRAEADAVCAGARAALAMTASPEQAAGVLTEQDRILRLLDPPANWADRHAALLGETSALSGEAQRVLQRAAAAHDPQAVIDRGWARLTAREGDAATRIAANGYRTCSAAGLTVPGGAPA